jgi:phospholipid/cholesterol/gamma-HCH transport system permease protein
MDRALIQPFLRPVEIVGTGLARSLDWAGHFTLFTSRTLRAAAGPPWRPRLIAEQSYQLGLRALPVALLTAVFVGMVIVLQTGYELQQFNFKQFAAAGAATALTREMIPIFVALVIGARTAASVAAELGTMRVTEQIDAMEVLDVDPRRYLIVPRVIASTLTLPILTVYADLFGLAGGMLVGVFGLNISMRQYINITLDYMTMSDVMSGLIKAVFFGAAIGICGCYHGFHAGGGAEGVGKATTRAVVLTLTSLILLQYILSSWLIYLTDLLGPVLTG